MELKRMFGMVLGRKDKLHSVERPDVSGYADRVLRAARSQRASLEIVDGKEIDDLEHNERVANNNWGRILLRLHKAAGTDPTSPYTSPLIRVNLTDSSLGLTLNLDYISPNLTRTKHMVRLAEDGIGMAVQDRGTRSYQVEAEVMFIRLGGKLQKFETVFTSNRDGLASKRSEHKAEGVLVEDGVMGFPVDSTPQEETMLVEGLRTMEQILTQPPVIPTRQLSPSET